MDLVSKSIMPDGLILKPSRPLGVPDFLLWELDTKLYMNGTSEFESWSEVAGIRFGILLGFNPGSPDKTPRFYHLHNYDFQKNHKADYHTTVVTRHKGEEKMKNVKWTYETPLRTNMFQQIADHESIMLVSFHRKYQTKNSKQKI